MKTPIDVAVKSVFDEIVQHAPDIGPAPTTDLMPLPASGLPRRLVVAVAAVSMVVAGVGAIAVSRSNDAPSDPATASPAWTVGPGNDAYPGVSVPGMTTMGMSERTVSSGETARRVGTVLADVGWTVEFIEDATRTVSADVTVEFSYFRDGDRRLFVVEGPPDLIDSTELTPTSYGYSWPQPDGAATVAVETADTTVIVRSETIDSGGSARTIDEVGDLAIRIAQTGP